MNQVTTLDRGVDALDLTANVDGSAGAASHSVDRAWWLVVLGVLLVTAIAAFAGWTIGRSGVHDATNTATTTSTATTTKHGTGNKHGLTAGQTHHVPSHQPVNVITVHTPDGSTKNIRVVN